MIKRSYDQYYLISIRYQAGGRRGQLSSNIQQALLQGPVIVHVRLLLLVKPPDHVGPAQVEDHVEDDGDVLGEAEHAVHVGLAEPIVPLVEVSDKDDGGKT